jgi:hypothetical protein
MSEIEEFLCKMGIFTEEKAMVFDKLRFTQFQIGFES